jgi:hypothetical protein
MTTQPCALCFRPDQHCRNPQSDLFVSFVLFLLVQLPHEERCPPNLTFAEQQLVPGHQTAFPETPVSANSPPIRSFRFLGINGLRRPGRIRICFSKNSGFRMEFSPEIAPSKLSRKEI